jgi:predicted nucleic acid-binding Zn ribbon protein
MAAETQRHIPGFKPAKPHAKFKARAATPQKIEQILRSALRTSGLDKEITRYQFVLHWPEIVGPEIAKRTAPECIRAGALVVRVADSAWAQELSFQKDIILKRLKKFLRHDEDVRDVMFYVAGTALGFR